jgi:hypothetical protein
MSKANYNSMVSAVASKSMPEFKTGYDPASIQEKIKNLKFASNLSSKPNKDTEWF